MKLQDVIQLAESFHDGTDYYFDRLTPDEQETIIDAARRVANPDYEAAAKLILIHSWKWVSGHTSWEHASDQQREAALIGARQVAAALGITEDTGRG